MAVIEIAKIQVRRGQENQTGVPQLDGGEFAWAADTEKLYIGLRRDDGGSRDANVEILTENHLRNFFELNRIDETYIYREGSTSSRVLSITAEEGTADEWERTIRAKLDDTVHITDFGVDPSAGSWDLRRLQLAIDRLFLNTGAYTLDPAKELFFPAGVYDITGTVYIPARTTIVGEGVGKTIFNLTSNVKSLFQTCDITSVGGVSGYKHFDSGSGNGADFTSQARNVRIENLTVQFDTDATTATEGGSLIKLDNASNSIVRNVEFKGNHTTNSGVLSAFDYAGITLRSSPTGTHDDSLIENCQFKNLYHGVLSNHDVRGTTIQKCNFFDLSRGVTFNDPESNDPDLPSPTSSTGPTHINVVDNDFDNIEQEAIHVGENLNGAESYITSQNNRFGKNVGNYMHELGNRSITGTSIISFLTPRNVSINDHFERLAEQNRWAATGEVTWFNPLVTGNTTLDNFYVDTVEIQPGGSATTILRLPITEYSQHLNIKYSGFREDANNFNRTVELTTSTSSVIVINDLTNIVPDYTLVSLGTVGGFDPATGIVNDIPPNTEVTAVDTGTNSITISTSASVTATTVLIFKRPVDRMGNVQVYLQDGVSPQSIIVDDYNYIRDDGGVTFDITIDATNKYYEINATLAGAITVPVTIEYQTKLML